jgi:hypothetical protein
MVWVRHKKDGESMDGLQRLCNDIFICFRSGHTGCSPSLSSSLLSNTRSSGPGPNVSHRHRLQAHRMTAPHWRQHEWWSEPTLNLHSKLLTQFLSS